MRQSHFLVAALLAFTTVGSGAALAFDQQTLGGLDAGAAAGYTDESTVDPQYGLPTNSLGNFVFTPSSNFSGSSLQRDKGGMPSFITPSDTGWQNLRPGGRLTH